MNLETFIKQYWNYYLDLERQLLDTKYYVEFGKQNNKTFSIEYLKLLQICCSEIDVVAKTIAYFFDSNFDYKKSNIQKWGFAIHNIFCDIELKTVLFNQDYSLTPWKKWEYEQFKDINQKLRYRLKKGKETPKWWTAYNSVKHARTSRYIGEETNFSRANLENVVLSLSALYILEKWFIQYLLEQENNNISIEESSLFI